MSLKKRDVSYHQVVELTTKSSILPKPIMKHFFSAFLFVQLLQKVQEMKFASLDILQGSMPPDSLYTFQPSYI